MNVVMHTHSQKTAAKNVARKNDEFPSPYCSMTFQYNSKNSIQFHASLVNCVPFRSLQVQRRIT